MENSFRFHGELFELRNKVLSALNEHDLVWPTDYGSVDIHHEVYGMVVSAITSEDNAKKIQKLLRRLTKWRHTRYYYDGVAIEIGWKVFISRDREDFDDPLMRSIRPGKSDRTLIQQILHGWGQMAKIPAWPSWPRPPRKHE